jgi:hypothetical protein
LAVVKGWISMTVEKFLIAIGLLVSLAGLCGRAEAQPVGTQADCMGIDVAQPLPVLACLRSFPNREQMLGPANECSAVQGSWMWMLDRYGLKIHAQTPRSLPPCPVIAQAIKIAHGTSAIWADCVVLGRVAGTPKHIQDCLGRFVPGGYQGKSAATIRTCDELYQKYELGLKYATPRTILRAATRSNPDPLNGQVIYYGPSPLDDPALEAPHGPQAPVLRKRDCGIAEQVMASFKANPAGTAQAEPAPNPVFPRSGANDIPTPTSPQSKVPAPPITVPVPRIQ